MNGKLQTAGMRFFKQLIKFSFVVYEYASVITVVGIRFSQRCCLASQRSVRKKFKSPYFEELASFPVTFPSAR